MATDKELARFGAWAIGFQDGFAKKEILVEYEKPALRAAYKRGFREAAAKRAKAEADYLPKEMIIDAIQRYTTKKNS